MALIGKLMSLTRSENELWSRTENHDNICNASPSETIGTFILVRTFWVISHLRFEPVVFVGPALFHGLADYAKCLELIRLVSIPGQFKSGYQELGC